MSFKYSKTKSVYLNLNIKLGFAARTKKLKTYYHMTKKIKFRIFYFSSWVGIWAQIGLKCVFINL